MVLSAFRRVVLVPVLVVVLGAGAGQASTAEAADTVTILDTLTNAAVTTQFSVFAAGGPAIFSSQFVGPQFTLTRPTVITEVGAFVNNCGVIIGGVPHCSGALPLIVQIRPEVHGVPSSRVIATFVLSDDGDPLLFSYESAATRLFLPPGTYFALFGTHRDVDAGVLLASATSPFAYQAGLTTLAFIDPTTGTSSVSEQFAAVRILGEVHGHG